MTHNWIDLVILGLLALFVGFGIWAGLVKSLFRLLAWVGGAAGSWFGSEYVVLWLTHNVASIPPFALKFSGLFIGFLVPFIVLSLIGFGLHKLVNASPLGAANRMGGGLLGLVKGLILTTLLMALLHYLPAQGELERARNSSQAYDVYLWGFTTIYEKRFP